jgi:hypothetical protein
MNMIRWNAVMLPFRHFSLWRVRCRLVTTLAPLCSSTSKPTEVPSLLLLLLLLMLMLCYFHLLLDDDEIGDLSGVLWSQKRMDDSKPPREMTVAARYQPNQPIQCRYPSFTYIRGQKAKRPIAFGDPRSLACCLTVVGVGVVWQDSWYALVPLDKVCCARLDGNCLHKNAKIMRIRRKLWNEIYRHLWYAVVTDNMLLLCIGSAKLPLIQTL